MSQEPIPLPRFTAIGASGSRIDLYLCRWQDSRAYMVTLGAGAYLVDPLTGKCEGVEGCIGYTLNLVPNALRRLFKVWLAKQENRRTS